MAEAHKIAKTITVNKLVKMGLKTLAASPTI